MEQTLQNISTVEYFFDKLIRTKVQIPVYMSNPPKTIQESVKAFVVVDPDMENYNAYGRGMTNIFLYTRPLADGGKDGATATRYESLILKAIEDSRDEHFKIRRLEGASDYDTQRDLHVNIMMVETVIV